VARAVLAASVALLVGLLVVVPASADHFANTAIKRTWDRTDKPVQDGQVDRTWMWGPNLTGQIQERYAESPGGMRTVVYWDKSRMEITNPAAPDDGVWYVTNGLLVVELVSGRLQLGDNTFEQREPAEIHIAGDPEGGSPTYAALAGLLDEPAGTDGAAVTMRMDAEGNLSNDPSLANMGVTYGHHVQVPNIDHQVASVFWQFMNSTGVVYDNGNFTVGDLFQDPFYATGYPIAEPYWSTVNVGGTELTVLWQCFERRCLTYNPANPEGWKVEAGNVGQHYHEWRYGTGLFSASLSGAHGVPPVDTDASGTIVMYLADNGTDLIFRLRGMNIEQVTAAHIHLAPEGEIGEVVAGLYSAPAAGPVNFANGIINDSFINDAKLTGPLEGLTVADLVMEIMNGNAYVNVHTTAHPDGEIRGQLAMADGAQLRANLNGASGVPPVDTAAHGYAWFELTDDGQVLNYEINVEAIEDATAAHIRSGCGGCTPLSRRGGGGACTIGRRAPCDRS
jgi:hypothetical protein